MTRENQMRRLFIKRRRKEKVIITEAAILRSRKRDSDDVIDQDMIGASKRNISEDMLSMVDGARFFA